MENDILIQEYETKLADIQRQFDEYKKETEANLCALKEENKNEIEKINARYREELRQVLSARSAHKKSDDNTEKTDDDADSDETVYESRFKKAIKKLKTKYKIGD